MADPAEAWIGIDLGTQGVRAIVAAPTGHVLGIGEQPLTSRRDGVRHEQDPAAWWEATTAACRAALATCRGVRAGALAACSTSGTFVLAGRDGRALTPGLMYDDGRAVADAEAAGMAPTWALPKLLWLLREHAPLAAGARLLHQADFVVERLVGEPVATDSSHALKTGYDVVEERWPDELLERLGVPAGMLPHVVRPGRKLGAIGAEAAALTGIARGTPVVAGMTDGCAGQLAAGALTAGSWNSVLGTTLVLKGMVPRLVRDPNGTAYSHRGPDGGWLLGGASSVGADRLGPDPGPLIDRAAAYEPSGVLTYPLSGRGERFPFVAPDARRLELGTPRDDADRCAGILQGVAFVERLCFDYLALLGAPVDGSLTLGGGGTRSRYWCQLRADVLARPVRLTARAEAAFGMALLAASGQRGVAETAADMVHVTAELEPRPARHLHEPYLRLVDELERRGWLPADLAAFTRERAGR